MHECVEVQERADIQLRRVASGGDRLRAVRGRGDHAALTHTLGGVLAR